MKTTDDMTPAEQWQMLAQMRRDALASAIARKAHGEVRMWKRRIAEAERRARDAEPR